MQELLNYTKQLQQSLEGLTKTLESTITKSLENMSKEDAEKYKEALNDPTIKEMAKKITELNNRK